MRSKLYDIGKNTIRISWNIVKYYSFFYVTTNYIVPVEIVMCEGISMEPTIKNYDILLSEKFSVRRQRIDK